MLYSMAETLFDVPPQDIAPKPRSRWKKAALAGLLSLLFAGAGQLVNRQPRKALVFALLVIGLGFLQAKTRLLLAFPTMTVLLVAGVLLKLGVAAEAAYSAARGKDAERPIPFPKICYAAIAIVAVAAGFFPSSEQVIRDSGFGAFVVKSGSMCPTVCEGERIVANRKAYQAVQPQRGDVVLVKHDPDSGPFLKRIIGLPGDAITQGPDGTVLVNGVAFHPPEPCGKPKWKGPSPPTCPMCSAATVKPGEYFVVGDDLGNSLDSRYKEFGPVTKDMLLGKVLFIAWPGSWSRIGCTVR